MHATMARATLLVILLMGTCCVISDAMKLDWCCHKDRMGDDGQSEKDKCELMVDVLNTISDTLDDVSTTFGCVERDDCETTALQEGDAHIVTVDAGIMYEKMKSYNAIPILSESYNADGSSGEYKATVYLKADQCRDDTSMESLENRRACSTGYLKTAGWRIPMGKMMAAGAMPKVNKDCKAKNDAESAAEFFSGMCVPNPAKANGDENLREDLCKACKDDCSSADPYAGYSGAFRGLAENSCDVAFAKHTTLDDVTTEDWWTYSQSDFKVLCPFGGCVDFAAYANHPECAWATTPSHAAIVNPSEVGLDVREDVWKIFEQANSNQAFKDLFLKQGDSAVNANDLIFKSSTTKINTVKSDMRNYLGDMYEVFKELEEVADVPCTGTNDPNIMYVKSSSSSKVPAWGIAVFVLMTVVLLGVSVLVVCMIRREKAGTPMFYSHMGETHSNPVGPAGVASPGKGEEPYAIP